MPLPTFQIKLQVMEYLFLHEYIQLALVLFMNYIKIKL